MNATFAKLIHFLILKRFTAVKSATLQYIRCTSKIKDFVLDIQQLVVYCQLIEGKW